MNSLSGNTNVNTSTPPPTIVKLLWRQQQELTHKSPDGVKVIQNSEDPLDIQANIHGPKGTPYEGGVFRVKIIVSAEFPNVAPKGYFVTKIYHPNVSEKGEICVNTLKKDWNPRGWSLYNVLEVIKCLLIIPFPESSLNEEAGKQFMEDYEEYFKLAKIYTNVHAMEKYKEKDSFFDKDEFNYNIVRSKTMHVSNTNEIFNRANSGLQIMKSTFHNSNDEVIRSQKKVNENIQMTKPNLNELPFIIRSNSFNNNNPNSYSDENSFSLNNNITFNYNNNFTNQTPKSKKDEIKKWLSRI